MTTLESSSQSAKSGSDRPPLEIRFHFVDGSEESFVQNDREAAERIRARINPSQLFSQSRIVVADDYSKSVFVCSQINRIDLLFEGSGLSMIPPDHVDLVELTETEFRERVPMEQPDRLERREQPRELGDLLVSFLRLRMRGGQIVYLMNETVLKLPVENQSFMQRLLSKGAYAIRLREGGYGFLNLQNLIGYSVYPGVPEIPVDAWMADSKGLNESTGSNDETRL